MRITLLLSSYITGSIILWGSPNKFQPWLKDKRVVCLDIPDEYEYMDPDLVKLLKKKFHHKTLLVLVRFQRCNYNFSYKFYTLDVSDKEIGTFKTLLPLDIALQVEHQEFIIVLLGQQGKMTVGGILSYNQKYT